LWDESGKSDLVRERPDLAKELIKLRLTDQAEFDKIFKTAVKALSATRKRLAIEIGNTHERHGGISTWIGSKEIHGYQAFDGPGGFDSYGGYGGSS
jgi:Golgi nucleoside diphosphatase